MFSEVKVGDVLLKVAFTPYEREEIVKVLRVMQTQFVVDGGVKVWKRTGNKVGGIPELSSSDYRYATAEDIKRIEERHLRKNLLDQINVRLFNYGSSAAYSTAALKKIVEVLDNDLKTT